MTALYHAFQAPLWLEHVFPDCECSGKRCSRCEQFRCVGCFHRFIHSKDGLRTQCKICRKAESQTAAFKRDRRKRDRTNAEHINDLKRARYASDPEKHQEQSRVYRENNLEKVRASYRRANKTEVGRQRQKAYRETHPEQYRQYARTMQIKRRALIQQNGGDMSSTEWEMMKASYNWTCLCCGKREPEIELEPDHVIPVVLGGSNNRENRQPLCTLCNHKKYTQSIDYRFDQEAL